MTHDRDAVAFRGMRGRNLQDQAQAMSNGYRSVAEMAMDELAALVLDLRRRVENLEAYTDGDEAA